MKHTLIRIFGCKCIFISVSCLTINPFFILYYIILYLYRKIPIKSSLGESQPKKIL